MISLENNHDKIFDPANIIQCFACGTFFQNSARLAGYYSPFVSSHSSYQTEMDIEDLSRSIWSEVLSSGPSVCSICAT